MTRIISGFAGSTTIAVPSSGTRPTSDRVREAVFSALDARALIDGARVLDLYAGSGALGLEALSRGAAEVTLVDSGAGAIRVARANAAAVARSSGPERPPGGVTVIHRSVRDYLLMADSDWDLVFVDPPYDLPADELVEALDALLPHLASDAVVVVERSARHATPRWPAGLTAGDTRDYGETRIHWLSVADPPDEETKQ